MPKNDRKLDTTDLSINGLLDAIFYRPTGAMSHHGGKRPREDEKDGGTRACGSHCGRDARASLARAKIRERGRPARFVGLIPSRSQTIVIRKKMTEIPIRQTYVSTAC
jgi:hypothetical protein